MSLNCLLWRGGGMVDTKDFEKNYLYHFIKIEAKSTQKETTDVNAG